MDIGTGNWNILFKSNGANTRVKNTLRQQPVINTIIYFSALLLIIFIGWFLTKINTNYLSVSAYGQFAFFITFISQSRSLFSFGVFESTSRLLAVTNEPAEKSSLLGSSLILALVFSLMASFFVYLSGIMIDGIFKVNIGWICQEFKYLWNDCPDKGCKILPDSKKS